MRRRLGGALVAVVLVLSVHPPAHAAVSALSSGLVRDVDPTGDGFPAFKQEWVTAGDGVVFFVADDGEHGRELWRSDGSAVGTQMVADINPGPGESRPSWLTMMDGILYFSADGDGNLSDELWRSDGTETGTFIVRSIFDGGPQNASGLVVVGSSLYFQANNGGAGAVGAELFTSDGTPGGTLPVADINPTGSSFPNEITAFGDGIVFKANDGTTGIELWVSDGVPGGTTALVADIHPTGGSNPSWITVFDGMVYFQATDVTNGIELFASDGIPGGTTGMVADIDPTGSGLPSQLTATDDALLFVAATPATNRELFKLVGNTFSLVEDIRPGNQSSSVVDIAPFGDAVYFSANDGTGSTLWTSAGTDETTFPVDPADVQGAPGGLAVVDGQLLFRANDATRGVELFASDGTADGTGLIADVNPGPDSGSPGSSFVQTPVAVAVDGTYYFPGTGPTGGRELHRAFGCGSVVRGSVSLTTDLVCSGAGLVVGGANTVIDLDGHTLTGSRVGVGVRALPGVDADGVRVLDGRIRRFARGISLTGDGIVVRGVNAFRNDGTGILVIGRAAQVFDSTASSNGIDGVFLSGGGTHQVRRTVANGNGDDGIDVNATSARVFGNTVRNNDHFGIEAARRASVRGGGNTAAGNNAGGQQCAPSRLC